MLSRLLLPLFQFFERRVNPYPEGEVSTPPKGLLPFIWHFSRPVWPWLLLMSLMTAVVSAAEVMFFSYMGELVDWLGRVERADFWAQHGLFASGPDFDITFGLAHTIEKSAEIYIKVLSAGQGKIRQTITDDDLRAIAHDFGVTINENFLD